MKSACSTDPMKSAANITSFRAILDGEEHEVVYQAGEVLLDCMLAEGLDPAFQCMDGRCGTCMVIRISGDVEMRKNNVLSQRDLDQDYVLLCQSIPLTDNVLVDCDV